MPYQRSNIVTKSPSGRKLGPYAESEFDYILTERSDLVSVAAPVGNVFTLPEGSYFVKDTFELEAGERILFDEVSARVSGGGFGKALMGAGDAAVPLISVTNGAVVSLDNFSALTFGDMLSVQCSVDSELRLSRMNVSSESIALQCLGGRIDSEGSYYRSTGNDTIVVGAAKFKTAGDYVRFLGEEFGALLLNDAAAYVVGSGSDFEAEEGSPQRIISVEAGTLLQLNGGSLLGFNTGPEIADGVVIRGDIQRVNLDGLSCVELENCVRWESGILFSAAIQNFATVACVYGVDWASASVPSQGLLETGNAFNMIEVHVFRNHNANDANVMRRSNSSSAGLMVETAIVT